MNILDLFKEAKQLGDILKKFEDDHESYLTPGLPIIIRLDGKGFHNFTKGLERPVDVKLRKAMARTTEILVEKFQAVVGYTQSDEITLVLKNDMSVSPNTDNLSSVMFGGRVQKLVSTTAATASVVFNQSLQEVGLGHKCKESPIFDSRVFAVPSWEMAALAIHWREIDAIKNAISMAASVYFSESILNNRSSKERLQLLKDNNVEFDDFPDYFKRGHFVLKKKVFLELDAETLAKIPEKNRPTGKVERSKFFTCTLPKLSSIENLLDILFDPSVTVVKFGGGSSDSISNNINW